MNVPLEYLVIGNILSFSILLLAFLNILLYKKYFNQVKRLVDPLNEYSENGNLTSVIRERPISVILTIIVFLIVFVPYVVSFYSSLVWVFVPFFLLFLLLLIISNIFVFVSITSFMFSIKVRTFFVFVFMVNLLTFHIVVKGLITVYNNGWLSV